MIRRILLPVVAAMLMSAAVRAADSPSAAFEQQLAAATKSSSVTVVHLWAPWCSNCKAELANGGWSGFIAANPDVNFVFVTFWNKADGHELLEKNGVGGQKNFRLLLHPNASRKHGEMTTQLLGLPVSWLPTTWIFQAGDLRYAMNYGELHFPMLQQLIRDSTDPWDHPPAK
jgi:thiol-disulfide isomerase/thioredoxin